MATILDIQTIDDGATSLTKIETNFNNLNTDKAEVTYVNNTFLDKTTFNNEKIAFASSSTGTDSYAITVPNYPANVNGQTFKVQADVGNTGSATLNINGLGAKSIKKYSAGSLIELLDGDIVTNQIFWVTFNQTEDCYVYSIDPAGIIIPQYANQSEAETGTDNTKVMTPLRVKNKINKDIFWYFGNGVDGDVTISSGTTTLTRDMYYNNLTITSPGELNPNGYKIFIKGTLSGNGIIRRNGNAGGNASGATGGTAGTVLSNGSITGHIAGVAGVNGLSTGLNGVNGNNGITASLSYSNINGANGGTGGGPTPQTGGIGGVSTRGELYNKVNSMEEILLLYMSPSSYNATLPTKLYASSQYYVGGGGGGGASGDSWSTGADYGGGGGGSGSNGGIVYISAYICNFTGTIEVNGGNGGNGGNGVNNGGGGGGGAGGSGGVIILIARTLTSTGTKNYIGGTGGTGGSGAGAYGAMNGGTGQNGSNGAYIEITI